MLLNDLHEKDRLAYLLGLTVERHVSGWSFWKIRLIAGLGAIALLALLLWQVL